MKKNKIIILSIASVLSVGVVAGSFAMFKELGAESSTTIGGNVSTDGALKLTASESNPTDLEFNYEINHKDLSKTFAYTFDMTVGAGSIVTQDVSVADLALTVNIPEELKNDITITPVLTGYSGFANLGNKGTHDSYVLNNYKFVETGAGTATRTYSIASLPFFNSLYAKKKQGISFEIKATDHNTFDEIQALAEKSIKYTLTLKNPSTAVNADTKYVRGTFNKFGCSENYAFVPSIASETEEYKYEHLELTSNDAVKFNIGDDSSKWYGFDHLQEDCKTNFNDVGGNDHNIGIKENGSYSMYWKANNTVYLAKDAAK